MRNHETESMMPAVKSRKKAIRYKQTATSTSICRYCGEETPLGVTDCGQCYDQWDTLAVKFTRNPHWTDQKVRY